MDDKTDVALAQSVEDEIRRGYKIIKLEDDMVGSLHAAHALDPAVPVFLSVRFTKLTPKKRRLINEAVIKVYHRDLQDKEKLSKEQIRKMNIERGEWSADKEKKLTELQQETTQMSRDLYLDGFDQDEWIGELDKAAGRFREILDETTEGGEPILAPEKRLQLMECFSRWYLWSPQVQDEYTERYADLQKREKYSQDADYQWLVTHSPGASAVDALLEVEEVRDRINMLRDYIDKRRQLTELQTQEAKMYAESVEQRRDQAEEYARLFYITEIIGDDGLPKGALTKTLEALWDFPEDVISGLLIESYFFLNGIPDEAKAYLQQMGFLPPPQASGPSASSDASPEEPSSKTDSTSAEATAADSLALTTGTT